MKDPDGRLTVIVHGTYAAGADYAQQDAAFNRVVGETFGESAVPHDWSGGNSPAARTEAAAGLKAMIDAHEFGEGESLNIVAHSHGGNVVKEYTQLQGPKESIH